MLSSCGMHGMVARLNPVGGWMVCVGICARVCGWYCVPLALAWVGEALIGMSSAIRYRDLCEQVLNVNICGREVCCVH